MSSSHTGRGFSAVSQFQNMGQGALSLHCFPGWHGLGKSSAVNKCCLFCCPWGRYPHPSHLQSVPLPPHPRLTNTLYWDCRYGELGLLIFPLFIMNSCWPEALQLRELSRYPEYLGGGTGKVFSHCPLLFLLNLESGG